jgi:hypothetical protein
MMYWSCHPHRLLILPGRIYSAIAGGLLSFFSLAVHATVPDINGLYFGRLSGTDVCPTPEPDSTDMKLTITQSGATFTFSGEVAFLDDDGSVHRDTFSGSGSIVGTSISGTFTGVAGTETLTGSFNGTIEDGGNSLSISISASESPSGCSWVFSGTLTRTSADIVVDPAVTPSSTLTAPLLLNTHVQNLTSNLDERISDVLRSSALGIKRTASGFMFNSGPSGISAGDTNIPIGVWASYSYSDYDNDLSSTAFDGHTHSVLAGADISPWERTVFGIAFGYENSDIDTKFNEGNQTTDGFTVAPYFGALLTDTWSVDFSFGYSNIESDQFRIAPGTTTRITSSPDADRWFAMLNLNGVTTYNNWIIGGRIGTLWARNITESFVESDGTVVPEIRSKLGQWRVGGDVAYSFGEWEPFARLTYEHDYSLTEIAVVGGPQPSNDRDNFLVGAGIRYFNTNGWSGNLEWNKRLGRDDFDEDSVFITIRGEF